MTPAETKARQDELMRQSERNGQARHVTPARAITAGLVAQLAGVGWEAVWHTGLSARAAALGTRVDFGLLGDHIVSNLGVLSILGGAGWLLARKSAWRRGAVLMVSAGAMLQGIGAAWDLAGHVRGRENSPIAYALLGLGFILTTGALVSERHQTATRA